MNKRELHQEKPLIDFLVEKFEKILPQNIKPYAFTIIFGLLVLVFVAWMLSIIVLEQGGNVLIGLILFVILLPGAIWIYVFVQEIISKLINKWNKH